jgi:acetylornithine/N-succinyldiaminopimelate aminotransferase
MPTYARAPLEFERGEGSWLFTAEGEKYLDFGAGIAVNCLGHAHPKLVEALETQARRVWHVSNLYQIPAQQALAEALVEKTFADTVFFGNSGAEAMELAIKIARKYWTTKGQPDRHRISPSKVRSMAGRWARSRRRIRTPSWWMGLALCCRASMSCRSATMMR